MPMTSQPGIDKVNSVIGGRLVPRLAKKSPKTGRVAIRIRQVNRSKTMATANVTKRASLTRSLRIGLESAFMVGLQGYDVSIDYDGDIPDKFHVLPRSCDGYVLDRVVGVSCGAPSTLQHIEETSFKKLDEFLWFTGQGLSL
jgi:hypothetical protein